MSFVFCTLTPTGATVYCLGICYGCGALFSFNPMRVPSIVINEVRRPVCQACVDRANPERVKNGLPPIKPLPGAYEPCDEGELAELLMMGLYNFQSRFVPLIQDGSKRHTIRGIRRHPDKPGDTCHLYTGLRHHGARLIFRAPCLRVEPIEIWKEGIFLADEKLSKDETDAFAWRDGFRENGFAEMLVFWDGRLPFVGGVTHWDYDRRQLPRREREAIA